MLYLVAYDVRDNKIRRRVAEELKNAGGERIQYSAFLVELSEEELEELLDRLARTIGSSRGRVVAIPICARDLEKVVTIAYNYRLPEEAPLL